MNDWQAGDLALCVDDSPCRRTPYAGAPWKIAAGTVTRVLAIGRADTITGGTTLILEGVCASHQDVGFGFIASRFRKIRPDEREACEPEFVTLLKRSKRKIEA